MNFSLYFQQREIFQRTYIHIYIYTRYIYFQQSVTLVTRSISSTISRNCAIQNRFRRRVPRNSLTSPKTIKLHYTGSTSFCISTTRPYPENRKRRCETQLVFGFRCGKQQWKTLSLSLSLVQLRRIKLDIHPNLIKLKLIIIFTFLICKLFSFFFFQKFLFHSFVESFIKIFITFPLSSITNSKNFQKILPFFRSQ